MTTIEQTCGRITFQRPKYDMRPIAQEFARIRPAGGAKLIFADPPWAHEDWSDKGDKSKTAGAHYETQPLEWIMQLPVGFLTSHDCLLFLWVTSPLLLQALEVVDAWGFNYKTSGVWLKRTVNGKLAFGPGRRVRSCHEWFILATKGHPPVSRAIRSALEEADLAGDPYPEIELTINALRREHSRKPDEALEAARLCVDGAAVELFSRETREGWISWGNQATKFDKPEVDI